MFKFVQNCTYLFFLLIHALKKLDGGGVIFINFAFSLLLEDVYVS